MKKLSKDEMKKVVGGNANGITGTVNITNNRRLGCSLSLDGSQDIYINNNYIYNYNNDFWNIGSSYDGNINGNTFYGIQLQLMDRLGLMKQIVHGNKFCAIDGARSCINLIATTPNTRIQGLSISGNAFIGGTTFSTYDSINSGVYNGGTFGTLETSHDFAICNNTNDSGVVNKQTIGHDTAHVSSQSGLCKVYLSGCMFYIPGTVAKINYLHIIPRNAPNSTEFGQQVYFTDSILFDESSNAYMQVYVNGDSDTTVRAGVSYSYYSDRWY